MFSPTLFNQLNTNGFARLNLERERRVLERTPVRVLRQVANKASVITGLVLPT
jgi:hypothetical protein